MIGKVIRIIKEEKGAVQIVEAAFVFPIMFIILFFLIYLGNAFYVKAQIESIVNQKAIEGAGYCADPILETIRTNNAVPELSKLETKPYRYLFGGMDNIEKEIGRQVYERISSSTASLFRNMEPVVNTPQSKIAHYNNYVINATFSVEVKCRIEFPIKFLGESTPYIMEICSRSEVAVNDTSELIRNTDMVIDYFEDSKLGQSIKGVFDKINEFITTFASK